MMRRTVGPLGIVCIVALVATACGSSGHAKASSSNSPSATTTPISTPYAACLAEISVLVNDFTTASAQLGSDSAIVEFAKDFGVNGGSPLETPYIQAATTYSTQGGPAATAQIQQSCHADSAIMTKAALDQVIASPYTQDSDRTTLERITAFCSQGDSPLTCSGLAS